jgi:hypothetical protein
MDANATRDAQWEMQKQKGYSTFVYMAFAYQTPMRVCGLMGCAGISGLSRHSSAELEGRSLNGRINWVNYEFGKSTMLICFIFRRVEG